MKFNKRITMIIMILLMGILLAAGCGKSKEASSEGSVKEDVKSAAALEDMNELPEDGIITKEQLETVAGQDRTVSFHATDADSGIEYTWTFDCSQIQNPVDQNLKIDFQTSDLDEVKKEANDANDALMMTMHGEGLVCAPTLELNLPECWQSDTVLLLKEQDKKLAVMSDVTIKTSPEDGSDENVNSDDASDTTPLKGTTKLTMNVTALDGDCYVVGGIANIENAESDEENTDSQSANSNDQTDGDVANNNSKNKAHYCKISISCKTILKNMDQLTDGKEDFVPPNGWILKTSEVEFKKGDSVHDVLKSACKQAGIHMESSYSATYNSAYVEGINQLYEFDCGELSGWMYSVNGWFPNYGCSKYTVEDGDVIRWVYTCDLGKDVGDNSNH